MSVLNDKDIDKKLLIGRNYEGLYVDEVEDYGIYIKQENPYMGLYDIDNLIEISKDLEYNNLFSMYIEGGLDISCSSEHQFNRNIEICVEGDVSFTNKNRYGVIGGLFLICKNLSIFDSTLSTWDCTINGEILQLYDSGIYQDTDNSNLNFQILTISQNPHMAGVLNDCWDYRRYYDYDWTPWKTLELPKMDNVHTIFVEDSRETLVFQKRNSPYEIDNFYQMVVVNDEWNFIKCQQNIDSFDLRGMIK